MEELESSYHYALGIEIPESLKVSLDQISRKFNQVTDKFIY